MPCVTPSPTAPKLTPTAKPSGILCNVMAETSSTLRRQLVWGPSASDIFIPGCRCGSALSSNLKNTPPARNPMTGGTHLGNAPPSERSIAGRRSDQKLAAIITPAANPSIESSSLRLTFFVPKTSAAPAAVIPHVNNVAMSACKTGGKPAKAPITVCPGRHSSNLVLVSARSRRPRSRRLVLANLTVRATRRQGRSPGVGRLSARPVFGALA